MKQRKFRLHFNRINMQRKNPRIWTVHTSDKCFQGEQVICDVPVETVFKPLGQQPRAYLSGTGFVAQHGAVIYIS